jgi:hypothetical protein
MLSIPQKMKEVTGLDKHNIPLEILTSSEPLLLRGLVADWPIVTAGKNSIGGAIEYIQQFYRDEPVTTFCAQKEAKGRLFYNEDCTGFDYELVDANLNLVLKQIELQASVTEPLTFYVGSTVIDHFMPGFRAQNDLSTGAFQPMVSIWMCNQSRVAAHSDLPDNIACSVVGHRRFTLFPPDQLDNLYLGPLDLTPAGRPISLVDFHNPDFEKFPKFKQALAHGIVADLEPGDAIYIPSMWWHHVESLDAFNVLVNYWWKRTPAYMSSPANALDLALLAIRNLPPEQKAIWQKQFDYYVFNNSEETIAHIPKAGLGNLGELDEILARKIRAKLLNTLNR